MLISELKRGLIITCCFIAIGSSAFAQALQPAPDLRLLNSGYGAAALGMGGAFTAVATDLSATFWNPGGAAQLHGMQFYVDYSINSDSGEDFEAEVLPSRFESPQRFSSSGNQFRAFAFGYTFETKKYRFTPIVAWQRTLYSAKERQLKETASLMNFITPQAFFQSEGTFNEKTDGGENEWAFGISTLVSKNILFGGTLNILRGSPETTVSGSFHDSFVNDTATISTDFTVQQKTKEKISGTYFKLGMLFFPEGPVRLGGTLRFPYTRTSTLNFDRTGNAVTDGISTPVSQSASADTEISVPLEWSAGMALMKNGGLISASVSYSDYSTTERIVTNSSNPALIPEDSLPYPLLRIGGIQNSLLQYRLGTEYLPGRDRGLAVRGGYLWDGQPYGNGERKYLRGYSIGGGYLTRTFRLDAAYVRETGDVRLTSFSAGDAHVAHRRFVVSISFLGQ